jgi:hypothetical protein
MRMNHPRPGHALLPAAVLVLAFGHALVAQTETPPTTAPPTLSSPSELYRDVKALRLVAQLELTTVQVEKILPVVQNVADQAAADQQADATAWLGVKAAADKVVAAMLAGVPPPAAETATLNDTAAARNERENARAALAADAAVQIQRMLTAEQASRIETAAEQAQRKALQARMGGAETPVEYILLKLDEQAELMPDEYVRTREDRAVETAEAILGQGAPGVRPLAVALLNVMNEVAGWTPQQYAQERPGLGKKVAEALKLPEAPDDNLIKYEDFVGWITSERTPVVLREVLAARKSAAPREGVAP